MYHYEMMLKNWDYSDCNDKTDRVIREYKGIYQSVIDFNKIWYEYSSRKKYLAFRYFFKGVKTTLEFEDLERILLNISEIVEDTIFV